MKKILIVLTLLASQVFAANMSLSGGESATIQANTNVRVTCEANGSSGDHHSNAAVCEAKCQRYLNYNPNGCASEVVKKTCN